MERLNITTVHLDTSGMIHECRLIAAIVRILNGMRGEKRREMRFYGAIKKNRLSKLRVTVFIPVFNRACIPLFWGYTFKITNRLIKT